MSLFRSVVIIYDCLRMFCGVCQRQKVGHFCNRSVNKQATKSLETPGAVFFVHICLHFPAKVLQWQMFYQIYTPSSSLLHDAITHNAKQKQEKGDRESYLRQKDIIWVWVPSCRSLSSSSGWGVFVSSPVGSHAAEPQALEALLAAPVLFGCAASSEPSSPTETALEAPLKVRQGGKVGQANEHSQVCECCWTSFEEVEGKRNCYCSGGFVSGTQGPVYCGLT